MRWKSFCAHHAAPRDFAEALALFDLWVKAKRRIKGYITDSA